MAERHCRFCNAEVTETFADLGVSPLANSYRRVEDLDKGEMFYPLHAYVCSECFLVQIGEFETPQEIFGDYAYFSSYSQSWLDHCNAYCDAVTERFALAPGASVVELASNDGYLLQYFRDKGADVLGIEPAANVAAVAVEKGIPTEVTFFGAQAASDLVARGRRADLLIGNNVLAHVPDLNDFVAGMKIVLADDGVITMEFPHLLRLIERNQFDTIYHEHFSYFSFLAVEKVFAAHGLRLFDVKQLTTHGGSIRIYGCHAESARVDESRVAEMHAIEAAAGLDRIETYRGFDLKIRAVKRDLLAFLVQAAREGKTVAGYGAPAKGNTLLNFCGVRADLLAFTVDRSPHKQDLFLPGTRIPIHAPEKIAECKPDYVLILPWNIKDEIMGQMAHVRDWGGQFVVPIPALEVLA